MFSYEYKTKGTCSQRIFFEIEDGKLKKESGDSFSSAFGDIICRLAKQLKVDNPCEK